MIQVVVVRDPFNLGEREVFEAEPATISELVPDDLRREHGVSALLNGVPVPFDEWENTTCDEGTIGFVLLPGDLITIGKIILYVVTAYAIGRIVAKSFAPNLRPPEKLGDSSSPIYNFDGVSNTRTEGIPLPLIFGKIRYGGNVVNEYLRSFGVPEVSYVHQQLSFGEGPVYSIDGKLVNTLVGSEGTGYQPPSSATRINDNSADNYSNVQVAVRLGQNEQEFVPGFEAVRTSYYAAFTLTSPITTDEDNGTFATGFSQTLWATTANDSYFNTNGKSIDITGSAVDSAIARLFFPRGLFRQDTSSGAIEPSFIGYAIRYRELDSAGNPITTGGHLGDGYVRLRPPTLVAREATDAFYLEAPIPFYDPQTYNPRDVGKCLDGSGIVTFNKTITTGTVNFWFKSSDTEPYREIHSTDNVLAATGPNMFRYIRWRLTQIEGDIRYEERWVSYNQSAASSGFFPWDQELYLGPRYPIAENSWTMVTVVKDYDDNRTRVYINDTLYLSRSYPTGTGGNNPKYPRSIRYTGGDPRFGFSHDLMQFDAFQVSFNHWSSSKVTEVYNQGFGRSEALYGDYYTSFNVNGDNAIYGDWAASGSGSTIGVVDGWIDDPTTGADPINKRSRYRVEVARTNVDSTASNTADDVEFNELQAVTENELTYPNSPILAIKVRANDQLENTLPTTTTLVEGLLVPVWDGESVVSPNIVTEYSANPAWICLGILTDKRWGLGATYELRDCINTQLYNWARYCDEVVYGGSVQRTFENALLQYEDIYFDNSYAPDGTNRGLLQVRMLPASLGETVPLDWEPGAYLRLHGFPIIGGGTDINQGTVGSSTAGGYEIQDVFYTPETADTSGTIPAHWTFQCFWDRLDEADPWTSGTYLSASAPGGASDLNGSTVEIGEKRHEFNGVFDREQSAWDAILEVATVGRAIPIREGTKVRFKYQHARTPVGVLTPATIVKNTFRISYTDQTQRANALDISIADKQQDYQLAPVTVLDPTITNVTSLDDIRKESRNYIGITSRGQAQRQALFELNINRLLKRTGQFTLGAEGLPFEPGDLVRLSHDLLPRGTGGRVLRASYADAGYMLEMLSDNNAFGGAAWTSSGVSVTANTASNPFGTATESDRLDDSNSSHNYIEQTGSITALKTDWVSLGIWIKPGTAAKSLVALVLPGGTASYLVTWSTGTAEVYGAATMPEKRRAVHVQQFGSTGWYRVTVSGYHLESDGAAAPIARIFPASDTSGSSGAATGNIEVWGAHLSYGRYAAAGDGPARVRTVTIDRDLVLESGTNKLYIRDYRDGLGDGTVDATLCPAGNYVAGDLIVTSADMATATQEDGSWIVCKSGDELVVEIVGTSINQDLTRSCEWIEYNEAIFDDVPSAESDDPLLRFQGNTNDSPPLLNNGYNESSLPEPTSIQSVQDVWVRRGPGQFVPTLYVSMEHARETIPYLARTELHWRSVDRADGAWQYAGSVSNTERQATVTLPQGTTAKDIQICAVPINNKGLRRPIGEGGVYYLRLRGLTAPPETPTSVAAAIAENQAIYGYTVTGDDLLSVECRRGGGWILGQQVFREEARQRDGARRVGPTFDWAGSSTATPTLRFAAMNTMGHYGVPATLAFNPTVDGDTLPFDGTAPDQAWESYDLNGWEKAVPTPGSALIGPEFEENAAGELVYTAASTSLAWETAYTSQRDQGAILTLEQWRQPRRHFVEAWVEAYAENEETWQDATWAYGDILYDRWTWEGPRSTVPEEPANPELEIQLRVNRDGTSSGWGDWRDYTPSIYSFVDVQFRLRVRRHHANQNVRILKFHTRITPPRMSLEDQTPMREFILHEMFQ